VWKRWLLLIACSGEGFGGNKKRLDFSGFLAAWALKNIKES